MTWPALILALALIASPLKGSMAYQFSGQWFNDDGTPLNYNPSMGGGGPQIGGGKGDIPASAAGKFDPANQNGGAVSAADAAAQNVFENTYGGNGGVPQQGAGSATAGAQGMDWFDQNTPPPTTGGDTTPPPTSGPPPAPTNWNDLQQSIFGSMPSVSGATPPPFSYAQFDPGSPFSAPSGQDVLNADPGYQFRLDQGSGAMQNSAAARGVLNTGGTLQDLVNYGQQSASQEYGNAYGRALNTYQTNYNDSLNGYITNFGNALTKYNTNYNTNYLTPYNQLMNQYQVGQQGQGQLFNQQFQTATA